MSRKITGLDFSSFSSANSESVIHQKCSLWLRLQFILLPLILLAGLCTANGSAVRTEESTSAGNPVAAAALESRPVSSYRLLAKYGGILTVLLLPALGWRAFEQRRSQRDRRATRDSQFPPAQERAALRKDEDERRYLSRELHDSVGQLLTAVGLQLRAIRLRPLPADQLRARLDEACRLNADALRLVRDLAKGLRPTLPQNMNFAGALQDQARQLFNHSAISTMVQVSDDLDELPQEHKLCIYRCVQEALTNCAKHSHATSVRILVSADHDNVSVTVEDDGLGFDYEETSVSGLGLLGIRERVAELNGHLSIVRRQRGGTLLHLDLPVSSGARV